MLIFLFIKVVLSTPIVFHSSVNSRQLSTPIPAFKSNLDSRQVPKSINIQIPPPIPQPVETFIPQPVETFIPQPVETPTLYKTLACSILEKTNDYRLLFNLSKLTGDMRLDKAAEDQCKNLILIDDLSHNTLGTTLSSRVDMVEYKWNRIAENILYEFGYGEPSAERSVNNWINSDGHAQNMRGPYVDMGSSFCISPNMKIFWVQVFAIGDQDRNLKYTC
jgi:uncharacterized protein YkwD